MKGSPEAEAAIAKASKLVNNARARAKKGKLKDLPFTLTGSDVVLEIYYGQCQATGLDFDLGPAPKGSSRNPFGPSLDRIDSSLGYTPDNVRMVIWAFNTATAEWNDEQFEMIYMAYHKKKYGIEL